MKEEKLTGRGKARLIARYLRPVAGFFALGLLFSLFSQVFNALIPQIVRVTVDSVLGPDEPQLPGVLKSLLPIEALRSEPGQALAWAAAAVAAFAVFRGLAIIGQRLFLAKGSEGFVKGIRDELFAHIQRLPFAWHTEHQTGEMIQRCTSDVEVVRTFVCNQLVEVIRTLILIAVYLWAMFAMNVKLALVSLAFVPLVALSSGLFYGRIASRFKVADEAEGELTTMVQENLTGVRVVRAFGRESFELGKFNEKNDRFSELWIRLGRVLAVYWASGTLLTCLQVMVVLILGVVEAVNGELSLGGFLAFVSYNSTLAWPVRSLGRVLADMSKAGVSMDRVAYILNAQEERELPGAEDAPMDGDIEFSHVSFGYEPGHPVLQLAARQDYAAFYKEEIAFRKLCLYPPYCSFCVVGFIGAQDGAVFTAAHRFGQLLAQQAAAHPGLPLRILGPAPMNIAMLGGKYRYKLTLKCRNDAKFRALMRAALDAYAAEKLPAKATVTLDFNSDGDI